jgi:vacuolar-type H+-ATPase subunit D/Vma8
MKSKIVSARISPHENEKLKESGYTAKDAILYFLDNISSDKSKKRMELLKIQDEIKDLETKLKVAKQKEKELIKELGEYGLEYSAIENRAVNTIIQRFNNGGYNSIEEFLVHSKNKDLIENLAIKSDLKVVDLINLVEEKLASVNI